MKYLALILFLAAAARAEDAPAAKPAPNSFDAFKIVTQKNIFDPSRSAPGQKRERGSETRPPKVEYLSLVGAMTYGKGDFAFFDGTSSDYRKTVKAGDAIAGYKIAQVTQTNVTLEAEGKTLHMPVGGQLKRVDEGEWTLNASAETFAGSGTSSETKKTENPGGSGSGGGSEPSDALKRLLERRKQEK